MMGNTPHDESLLDQPTSASSIYHNSLEYPLPGALHPSFYPGLYRPTPTTTLTPPPCDPRPGSLTIPGINTSRSAPTTPGRPPLQLNPASQSGYFTYPATNSPTTLSPNSLSPTKHGQSARPPPVQYVSSSAWSNAFGGSRNSAPLERASRSTSLLKSSSLLETPSPSNFPRPPRSRPSLAVGAGIQENGPWSASGSNRSASSGSDGNGGFASDTNSSRPASKSQGSDSSGDAAHGAGSHYARSIEEKIPVRPPLTPIVYQHLHSNPLHEYFYDQNQPGQGERPAPSPPLPSLTFPTPPASSDSFHQTSRIATSTSAFGLVPRYAYRDKDKPLPRPTSADKLSVVAKDSSEKHSGEEKRKPQRNISSQFPLRHQYSQDPPSVCAKMTTTTKGIRKRARRRMCIGIAIGVVFVMIVVGVVLGITIKTNPSTWMSHASR